MKNNKKKEKNINNNINLLNSLLLKDKEEFAEDFYDVYQERLEERVFHIYNILEDEINQKLFYFKNKGENQ